MVRNLKSFWSAGPEGRDLSLWLEGSWFKSRSQQGFWVCCADFLRPRLNPQISSRNLDFCFLFLNKSIQRQLVPSWLRTNGSFHLDGFSKLHQSQMQHLVSRNNWFSHWHVVPATLTVGRLLKNGAIRTVSSKLGVSRKGSTLTHPFLFVSGVISMFKRPYLQQSTSSLAGAGRAECAGNWCSNKWRNPAAPLYQQALCWETGGPLC